MQKIFKRVAIIAMIAVTLLCAGLFASACSDGNYTITVYYSDGTTVADGEKDKLEIQICVEGSCYSDNAKVDSKGVAKFNKAELDEWAEQFNADEYIVHVICNSNEQLKTTQEVTFKLSDSSVKVVLADKSAS